MMLNALCQYTSQLQAMFPNDRRQNANQTRVKGTFTGLVFAPKNVPNALARYRQYL